MYIIIIQGRMGSTRLPGKILKKILDKEIIFWSYNRCLRSKADKVIIATSTNRENDILEKIFLDNNIPYFRGSENDLLDRYYQIAKNIADDDLKIVRVTSDCPFVDPLIINEMIDFYEKNNYDYIINNSYEGIITEGSYVEIINFKSLEFLWKNEQDPSFREHATGMLGCVSKYDEVIKKGLYVFLPKNIDYERFKRIKLSIDTESDYEKSVLISNYFNNDTFRYEDILQNYDSIFIM